MNRCYNFLSLIFCFVILTNACEPVSEYSGLEKQVDEMIPETVNDTTPGLVVGVVQNGKLVFQKGYGLANLNYDMPNDPEMVYNIGSVTKQFLGYAFAMQHVAGTLDLDDPVSDYLEDWPEFDEEVTLRNLLNHSSGYREAYTMSTLAGRVIGVDRLSQEDALEVVRRQPELEFSPDSRYTYNSTAWVILAEIFEIAAGESAAEWVDKNILDALDMDDTQIETYVGQPIKNAAESYSYNEQTGYTNEKSNRAIFGAADVFMNVPDAARWIDNFRTAKVGGSEVMEVFLEPNILTSGNNSGYALGIGVGEYRGLRRYRHTGGHAAFGTQLSYYPDHDLGIFIVSNFNRAWLSSEAIAELILGEYMEPVVNYDEEKVALDEELLSSMTGRYINEDRNDFIDLRTEGGNLVSDSGAELIPVSQSEFRINGSDSRFYSDTSEDGTMTFTVDNTDGIRVFSRMEVWEPDRNSLEAYAGQYISDEIDSIMRFEVNEEETLVAEHRWLGAATLNPLARDIFQADNGLMVEFIRDGRGIVSGFFVNSGRTLNVWFGKE
ncbi:serine hydrolase domain-containing protein [Balneola sp. MJW-20]|uniref:serine hydrolase domain-containing protein n=1 Tax=Gracilimonas aurantiaca TaxID=3234185 RepID=UPI003909D488